MSEPRLLPRVSEAAQTVREAEALLARAREELHTAIKAAAAEGIPSAAIARAAELSQQRVSQIVREGR